MIQIYGSPKSSASRCFLILEECGLSYEVMPLDMMGKKEHKSEQYLKLNPNGKVPCLVDDGFILWESAAIVHYIADKYMPSMLGATIQDKALVNQWSYWSMTEMQPPLVDILIQKLFVPDDKRDLALLTRREQHVPILLDILEGELANKKYLVGNVYSVADIMIGSSVNLAMNLKLDLSKYPNIKSWFAEIKSRPAWLKLAELRGDK